VYSVILDHDRICKKHCTLNKVLSFIYRLGNALPSVYMYVKICLSKLSIRNVLVFLKQ